MIYVSMIYVSIYQKWFIYQYVNFMSYFGMTFYGFLGEMDRFDIKEANSAGSDCKESALNAGDLGSIPGLGRSPGEGNGNLL